MFRRTIVRQFDWFFFGLLFCLPVLTLPSNGETPGRDAKQPPALPAANQPTRLKETKP